MKLESLKPNQNPLERSSEEERKIVQDRLSILSPLCLHVGQDFNMKVEVNPDSGWHWDFQNNVVRADPEDLLHKPLDYLRFVIQHEAGHRRISRVLGLVPDEVWSQPGFSFMMNAIEDPRDNNFVADTVPKFKEEMIFAYDLDHFFEQELKQDAKEKAGEVPKFMQAGLEYIKLWIAEAKGQKRVVDPELPQEVQDVVKKTLDAARKSWNVYPTKQEADNGVMHGGKKLSGEEAVVEYARASYNINHNEVWPIFKTLIDKDIEDLKEKIKQEQNKGGGGSDKHNKDEQDKSRDSGKGRNEKDNEKSEKDNNSKENEQDKESGSSEEGESDDQDGDGEKRADDKKSQNQKSEIADEQAEQMAREIIKEIERELNKKLAGEEQKQQEEKRNKQKALEEKFGEKKSNPKPDQQDTQEGNQKDISEKEKEEANDNKQEKEFKKKLEDSEKRIADLMKALEDRHAPKDIYGKTLTDMAPYIDHLENELKEIFDRRKHKRWETGYKSGKKLNMKQVMQDEAQGVGVMDAKPFMRRDAPSEEDYAIELLVDLSGSMSDNGKIQEAFKGVVMLTEALNNIGIKLSVTGFNDRLYQYKNFDEEWEDEKRKRSQTILEEVKIGRDENNRKARAAYNDDAWALDQVSKKLNTQEEKVKILFVISDGQPAPSSKYDVRDVSEVVNDIKENTKIKVIGLGLGRETNHVSEYYPDSVANIPATKLAEVLAEKVRSVIEGN